MNDTVRKIMQDRLEYLIEMAGYERGVIEEKRRDLHVAERYLERCEQEIRALREALDGDV